MKNKKSIQISTSNAKFNCNVLGNGAKSLIAFHGFGQDGNVFISMAQTQFSYTVYSFDLPFHGTTEIRNENAHLSVEEIQEMMRILLVKTGIEHFSIIAFSIGAKFAFPIIEVFATKIENIWLLAPDGIKISFWYSFATKNKITRSIFQYLMNSPQILIHTHKLLKSMKLIDPNMEKLVLNSINTSQNRARIYNTWNYLKNLNWNGDPLSKVLERNSLQMNIVLGESDTIISKRKIERVIENVKNIKLILLQCGHFNLIRHFSNQSLLK